jgi:hypothetical protein
MMPRMVKSWMPAFAGMTGVWPCHVMPAKAGMYDFLSSDGGPVT